MKCNIEKIVFWPDSLCQVNYDFADGACGHANDMK